MQAEFSHQDIEILDRRTVYQGFFKMEKLRLRFKLFRGGWSPILERELFVRNNAVAVLPYDPIRDEIILVQQMRLGAVDQPTDNPWLYELVAGIIEENEQPEQVAHREMQEESGLNIIQLNPIYNFFVSPGGSTEKLFLFLGIVDTTNAGGIFNHDENEDICVHVLKTKEVFEYLDTGIINNAYSIIALQWLKLNHENFKKKTYRDF